MSDEYVFLADGTSVWLDVAIHLSRTHGMRPTLWVGHPNHCETAKQLFPGCSVWDERRLNFGDFPASTAGGLPSSVKNTAEYVTFETAALGSLNRNETFRRIPYQDRMIFLSALGDFLWEASDLRSVKGFVGSQAPHSPAGLLLSGIMAAMGHELLHFDQIPLVPYLLPRLGARFVPVKVPRMTEGLDSNERERVRATLEAWLRRSKDLEIAPWEKVNAQRAREQKGLVGWARRIKYDHRLMGDLAAHYPSSVVHPLASRWGTPSLLQTARVEWQRERRLRELVREFNSSAERALPRDSFGLFLLHYEPEKTTMPNGGLLADQLAMIRRARSLLPVSSELLVKEHPSQLNLSTNGYVGRSSDFYRKVAEISGVRLLEVRSETREWITNAEVVFTVTGTVGIEAAMAGIPVLYFGFPWYAGISGVKSIAEVDEEKIRSGLFPSTSTPEVILEELSDLVLRTGLRGLVSPGHVRRFSAEGWEELYDRARLVEVVERHLGVSR